MYLVFAIIAGIIGGLLSVAMRAELMYPGPADLRRSGGLQRLHHLAWPDHDLLHGHARHDRWLRQLVRADHDRGAGHGLPAHEQTSRSGCCRRPSCFLIISLFMPSAAGSTGVGGGWTLYPPLSTSGQPGPAMDFRHSRHPPCPAPPRSSGPSTSSPPIFNMRAPA